MGLSSSVPYNYETTLLADTNLQSICMQDDQNGAEDLSPIYRHLDSGKQLMKFPFEGTDQEIRTIWDAIERGARIYSDLDLFGVRIFDEQLQGAYKFQSYRHVHEQATLVGYGLLTLGLNANSNIGIFSPNRPEWMISAMGIYSQRMRVVALYATLGPSAVEYIANHAEISVMFIAKSNVGSMLPLLSQLKLTTLIQFDANETLYGNALETIDPIQKSLAGEHNVRLIGLSDLLTAGAQYLSQISNIVSNPPTPDDIAYIMYTSGTTGIPKGALLTHGNIVSGTAAVEKIVRAKLHDIHYSFLPLAHIYETDVQIVMLLYGGKIGYWQGNMQKLNDDLLALRPTVFMGVPRVFTRIHQRVVAQVNQSSFINSKMFYHGYNSQLKCIRNHKPRWSLYDKKIFNPIAAKLGLDRCRVAVSGAAPLPPNVADFVAIVFNVDVVQGYGLTETAAGLCATVASSSLRGHVGAPVPSCEIRLRSVPEMEYSVLDTIPRGEVLVRGSNVFQGYFKDPVSTAACLSSDRWFSTGDIGRINPNGTLSIIDRKKNIFKLSQGEYVASEQIENVYAESPLVSQVWAYGNSFKSFLLGVIVPAVQPFIDIGTKKGWYNGPCFLEHGFQEAFASMWTEHFDELKVILLESLRSCEKSLKGFEKFRDIIIEYHVDALGQGFTESNSCLTATYKLRVPYLVQRYIMDLNHCYSMHGEPTPDSEAIAQEAA